MRAGGAAEGPVQRVGRELGGVALGGAQPAELGRDALGADARGVEQRGATHERDGGAAGGDDSAAAAGVEAGVEDASVGALRVERDREADQIAAGRAACRAGYGIIGHVTAPEGVFEMVDQLLGGCIHASECRARAWCYGLRRSPVRSRTCPARR